MGRVPIHRALEPRDTLPDRYTMSARGYTQPTHPPDSKPPAAIGALATGVGVVIASRQLQVQAGAQASALGRR